MKLYCGIDLHGNNSFISIIDETDRVMFEKRMDNNLETIVTALEAYRKDLVGIVVESTFNWYWLVDGLMDKEYKVHLANPAAIQQYDGLKFSNDKSDARWLAHMLRLGILPEGYIYPKAERAVRDLLRKRGQLVRYRTSNLLSINNLVARNYGSSISVSQIRQLDKEDDGKSKMSRNLGLAVNANLAVLRCLDEQIKVIEREVIKSAKLRPEFSLLHSVIGIGDILALTIALETGDVGRFPSVGDFSSYCRTVNSERISNGKKKGKGNTKCGNKYLAWAFIEAANFAVRFNEQAKKFYQRKSAKTNPVIARKALANKLARACYYIMRDKVPFDNERLFTTK
jgi:transposase